MSSDTSFAELVKTARHAAGMSQAALADLVGRSSSAVRGWERGSSTPTDENVVRSIAAVLGIDEEILRDSVGMPTNVSIDEPEVVGGEALEVFAEEEIDTVGEELESVSPPTEEARGADLDAGEEQVGDSPEEESPETTETHPPGEPMVGAAPVAVPTALDETGTEDPEADLGPGETEAVDSELEESYRPAFGDEAEAATPAEGRFPVSSSSFEQALPVEPILPATSAGASPTVTIPVGEGLERPAERSYLDDPDQMMTYWIRAALTVAFAVFLLVVLFWALGRLGDSVGEVWDIFKAGA